MNLVWWKTWHLNCNFVKFKFERIANFFKCLEFLFITFEVIVKQVCDSNMDDFEVVKSKIFYLFSIFFLWVKLLKPLFTMFTCMSNWQYTWLFQNIFFLPIYLCWLWHFQSYKRCSGSKTELYIYYCAFMLVGHVCVICG